MPSLWRMEPYIEEKVIENKNKNVRKAHEKRKYTFFTNEIEMIVR
jgi:hypothetical protein